MICSFGITSYTGQSPASGGGKATFESVPRSKDVVEKKTLAMLKDLDQNQRRGIRSR